MKVSAMHELSIAMSILDVVEEESARRAEGRVTAVHLKLGPLSGVVKESLLAAFDLAREETDLKECQLMIEEIPIVVFCPTCDAERSVVSIQNICCAVCATPTPEVLHGRELEVCQ
jgi:hydrogenase nickel incorporation protein HypA/HybF